MVCNGNKSCVFVKCLSDFEILQLVKLFVFLLDLFCEWKYYFMMNKLCL